MDSVINFISNPISMALGLVLLCVVLGRAVKIAVKHRETHLNMEISGRQRSEDQH